MFIFTEALKRVSRIVYGFYYFIANKDFKYSKKNTFIAQTCAFKKLYIISTPKGKSEF